ncbi:MAG: isochorismatase family protein [Phycisphaerales bacterium]|nr:MAG: isochorismatase family protein [Phycisphaerales bacterium]
MGTIFWDVDTQFDFMMPEGRLYVPGAETIVETISAARRWALDHGSSIIADIDWHSTDDPEISETPDFKETFPPHCMAGHPGSERVGDLGQVPIDYVEFDEAAVTNLRKLIQRDPFHIVIRKNSLDVFENPNADKLVDLVNPQRVVVFGVALDFCVAYVLRGLARHEGVELFLLEDATKGLGSRPEAEICDELQKRGVHITTLDECKRRLTCG